MYSNEKKKEILAKVLSVYPDAKAELNYNSDFEFLIAVMLSAQTTDKNVNKVTEVLFSEYDSIQKLKNANIEDIQRIIKPLGMYQNKSKNILEIAKLYDEKFKNKMPLDRETMMEFPGVGRKTASVVLSTLYKYPYMAVDTHVNRVCVRLKIVSEKKKPDEVSLILEKVLKAEDINQYHHSILFFGRYLCKAKDPECYRCKLVDECKFKDKQIK